ncbi:MAG: MFS transporter [candidate division SR1 bacterium]|nr:MFS transporter [candidate division SR1 bacterium]
MKNRKTFLKGISRNVLLLGLVSLLTDLSSQMVFPLIPLFLASLGAGATVIGVVEGAADSTAALLKVFSGYLSDKFKKRKIFVLVGYAFSTITKPLFALAKTWPSVLVFRVIERIGKGLRDAPRDALVADSTAPEFMGKAYGIQRAMDGIGSVLGAVLALVLFPLLGYQNLFLFAFFPGLIAVIAILFVKEAKDMKKEQHREHLKVQPKIEIPTLGASIKLLPNNLKLFILVSALFGLVNFGYAFLLLKAKSVGATDHRAIVYYVIFYGVYTLISTPVGILSDRWGRKTMLWIGYSLFLLVTLGLALVSQLGRVISFFVVFGLVFAIVDGTERALVVDLAGKNQKGTALGIFHTAIGIVALPGGYILGMLWDKFNPEATFLFAFAVGIIIMVLFKFVNINKQENMI